MRKPVLLFVGRTRYRLPLAPGVAAKFDALRDELDVHVLASAASGSIGHEDRFDLVAPVRPRALDGLAFWVSLPWRVARLLRRLGPEAVVAQSPYEGLAALVGRQVSGVRTRVLVEVHGDWRTATRLYGSPLRRALAPVADRLAGVALLRADGVRTISPYTSGLVRALGVEPAGTFPTFADMGPFAEREPVPPPAEPTAVFVGVLEDYKNIDGLADAWRLVERQLPEARLHVVGKGSRSDVVEALLGECSSVRWTRELDAAGVAAAMDGATLLVLPSRSEGMGRVVIEAFCRARPVVGTSVGGIADLVQDGRNGVLVEPGSVEGLAGALVDLLRDPERAAALGVEARKLVGPWLQTPREYASRMRAVVEGRSQ